MAATSFTRSLFSSNPDKYDSFLVGNAAYDPAATWLIQRIAGDGSATSITFSSIPQNYQHLQIRWTARTDAVASNRQFRLEINGDTTTTNYITHLLFGEGTAASATSYSGTGYLRFNTDITGASLATGIFGVGIVDLHDYASTTKNKTVRAFQGYDANGSGYISLESGLWISTSAVTQLKITPSSGSFIAGSTFALYGMIGA